MTTLAITRPTIWRATLLALAVSLLVALVSPTASHAVEVDPPAAGEAVLVVAPHPGDATIMAGGITYALASDVTIAYMTNSDLGVAGGDDGTLQLEAVTAQTGELNRVEDDLVFLGYPDGELALVWGTAAPTAFVASTGLSATNASRGLGLTDWHDFRMGAGEQHADYNQEAMIADMEALIDARRPAHIFTGGPENLNTDYTTTYEVVAAALDNVVAANPGYGAVLHTTVVWHPDVAYHGDPFPFWPTDRDSGADIVLDTTLAPPPATSLADVGLVWADREQFVIPTAWQSDTDGNPKALAIDDFVSQSGLGGFIGRFVHRDEIFWAEYVNYPELSISDATVVEGGNAVFTVSRTGALNVAVSVTATTSDGTAGASDYTTTSSAVDLAVGAASGTFTVPTTADDVDELDETFTVTLSAPTNGATLAADPTGTGTITDDDTAGVTVDEGDGLAVIEGGALDTYTVVLDSEPTADVVITATPDAQVTAAPSPLTFTAANWDTPQTVSVTGIVDAADEGAHVGTITHVAASTDVGYDGISVAAATADVSDPTALTVAITGPKTAATGLAAEYTAVAGGANGTVTYAWTVTQGTTTVETGTGAAFSFTPTLGGIHTVTVVPTDDSGTHGPVSVTTNVLTDITTSTFVLDILWLADNGITAGCNPPANDQFCPGKNVTRGQMAAFLVRFLGLTDDGGGNTFTDDDGSVFEDDIAKLAAAGITTGCNADGTNFCPGKSVTRGQMAAFLKRASALSS